MSIRLQNAPSPDVVGWHTTADGGQGYWNGTAWTVSLAASGARQLSESDTASDRVKAAVRAQRGTGATVLPPGAYEHGSPRRDRSWISRLLARRRGAAQT